PGQHLGGRGRREPRSGAARRPGGAAAVQAAPADRLGGPAGRRRRPAHPGADPRGEPPPFRAAGRAVGRTGTPDLGAGPADRGHPPVRRRPGGADAGAVRAQARPAEAVARTTAAWEEAYWASLPEWEHQVVTDVRPALYSCFDVADLLISDVSSVISDFLASEKPYAVANTSGLPEEAFRQAFPTVEAAT